MITSFYECQDNMRLESCLQVSLPDDSIVSVNLIKSKRSRRLSIRVDRYGVSVVCPLSEDLESIRNFISVNNKWILKKTRFYKRLNDKLEYDPLQQNEIIYLGKKYGIQIVKDHIQYATISDNLMKITFHVKDRRTFKRSLVGWYMEQTKKILDIKVPFYGKQLSVSYGNVRIKNQKTRWGSCSKHGNLNFNLLLSALPINIIDYIIIHELFHLIEFNHSNVFWKLVQDALPTYKQCRAWLKDNGSYIQLD